LRFGIFFRAVRMPHLGLGMYDELPARSQYRAPREVRLGSVASVGLGSVAVFFLCAVFRRWVFSHRLSPFLSFSSFLIFASLQAFRFSHPPAPFWTISDV
jgi:hypothetical protein